MNVSTFRGEGEVASFEGHKHKGRVDFCCCQLAEVMFFSTPPLENSRMDSSQVSELAGKDHEPWT